MEDLKRLISLCAASVMVSVNDHKDSYQSVLEHMNEQFSIDPMLSKEIGKHILDEMIRLDTVVNVHFYPNSPVGFHRVFHYDIEEALKIALTVFE